MFKHVYSNNLLTIIIVLIKGISELLPSKSVFVAMSFKVLLSTLSYSMSFSFAHGSISVTLTGDSRDKNLQRKKKELEEKGLNVHIEEINSLSLPAIDTEHPFVSLHRGTILKHFRLKNMNGQWIDSNDFAGKLIHISIWSVHNRSSIEEFEELNRLKEKHNDAVFLAIAPETRAEVRKVLDRHPLDYIIIPGARKFCEELGVDGYPKHLFVDQEGMIVEVTEGSNYTGVMNNGEVVMQPNNLPMYEKAMRHLEEFGVFS